MAVTDGNYVIPTGIGSGTGSVGTKPEWQTDEGNEQTYVAPEGPYGSNLKPGTIYTMTASGSFGTVKFTPSSSGGGGSSVSVSLGTQLGANRYSTYTDAQGNLWQIDNADGSQSIIQRASNNPADKNGDGLDDTTNMAVGVYKWDGSPTGFGYGNGIAVWPDGSKYTGGLPGDKPNLSTVTMYGPQGQGMYVVDEDYNIVKYLGPTTAAGAGAGSSSSSSSSGDTIKFSGISGSSGGGTSGSSSSYFDPIEYALEADAKRKALEAELQLRQQYREPNTVSAEGDASRAFQAQQNEIDRQIRLQEAADRKNESAADRRLKAIDEFRSAVTDTDPSAVHSWLYANGVGAGGNIVNRLGEGTDALSPNALAGAAALLQELRGGGQQAPMDWLNSVPGLAAATTPTTPGAGPGSSSPASPGPAATMSTGMPSGINPRTGQPYETGTAAAERPIVGYDERGQPIYGEAPTPATPAPVDASMQGWKMGVNPRNGKTMWVKREYGQQVQYRDIQPGDTTGPKDYTKQLTGQVIGGQSGSPRIYEVQGGMWWDGNSLMTAEQAHARIREVAMQNNQTAGQKLASQVVTGQDGVPMTMGQDGQYHVWNYGTNPSTLDMMATGGVSPKLFSSDAQNGIVKPAYEVQKDPGLQGVPATPYGNDNIQNEIPLPNKVVVPGLSRGGPVNAGMAVVGEGGGRRPLGSAELLIDPTRDAQVVPLTSQRAQALMGRGLPGYDRGTYMPEPTPTSAYTPTPSTAPTPTGTAGAPPPTGAATTSGVTANDPERSNTTNQPGVPPVPGLAPTTPSPPGQTTVPGQPIANATGSVYNTQNLTPEQLALLDEVTRVRASTPLPDIGGISPYSFKFRGLNPSSQTAWLQGMAARKGVPVQDFINEIQRQAALMPGLSRASATTGY